MGDDGKKKSYLVQNIIICVLFSSPLVFAGYAAHAFGKYWLLVAAIWIVLLALFFSYCPDDEEGEETQP